jgi:4-hydroxy-tetrahydrodipicolinate synthase
MFTGSMVALVTPFKGGKIDRKKLEGLIEFQIEAGTDSIIPCGTTGESATLSAAEHKQVVEWTIQAVNGRVAVIAGTGSNNTGEAVEYTRHAKQAGADGALLITPYYNKPTQEGLYQHFAKVAAEVDLPFILYNVPGRTGINMLPDTVARLAKLDNIVGIKEATGSLTQVSDIISKCPADFSVVSGDDFTTLPLLAVGGKGVISVTANVAPADMAAMWDNYNKGDYEQAKMVHYKLWPLHCAMFIETNPIPAKTALALMGRIEPEIRLPLTAMKGDNLERLTQALREYGLL